MKYIDSLSNDKIAEILGINVSAVSSRLKRLKAKARNLISIRNETADKELKKDNINFKKQFEKKLKLLNSEQINFFTWLCAIRILPFLSVVKNFNYWYNEYKHIYSVFYALDIAYSLHHNHLLNEAKKNINDAVVEAFEAEDCALSICSVISGVIDAVEINDEEEKIKRVMTIVNGAIYSPIPNRYTSVSDTVKSTLNKAPNLLQEIFFNDIENIISKNDLNCDIEIYGELWVTFKIHLQI